MSFLLLPFLALLATAGAPGAVAASFLPAIEGTPVPTDAGAFMEASLQSANLIFGLLIGVMLTASAYLFFIWIAMKDRSQIFLLVLLFCLAVNMASTNEAALRLIGLYNPYMIDLLQSYSLILAYFFSIVFTLSFLEVESTVPAMNLPLLGLGGLLLMVLGASALRVDTRPILALLGTMSLGAVLGVGLVALRQNVSGALSHLMAFSAFLAGGLAAPMHDLGLIPEAQTANTLMSVGYAAAAMTFAIVLAGQFTARQEEKERALEISNERFSLAARGSNEGLFDWALATDTLYISEQFRRIMNLPRPFKPRTVREWLGLVRAGDRLVIVKALRRLRASEGTATVNVEYRIHYTPEETRWIHMKMVAVKARGGGRIERLVGSIGDITQRKRGEVALRVSESRFRSITEAHPVPVLIARLSDRAILYASPGAESLLGLHVGTLLSHKLDRFLTRALERQEIMEAMEGEKEVTMKEVTLSRGDGEPLPAALSARRISYQNEAAMVVGLYDLTERKKAEARIAQQQESLQQSEKMAALGGLLAGVAHELNNPLSVVMGQTTLLIETQKEEKVKTRAEKIFKAADRCSRIVKSFLSLARRKPPEHKDVEVNSIINASLELLSYQFRNENVALSLDLAAGLPPIVGDDDQLTQVFTNLALNAAQAMHNFEGLRSLTIRSALKDEKTVVVSVIDTGPGVPSDLRKKVFEPFFTTKTGTGGTGVGLALCLNIIESHGGVMRLEDTPGGGATFVIEFPASLASCADVQGGAHEGGQTSSDGALPALRLLLVDDEVELAQTLADLLEPEGHDIDLAANGAIALEKLVKRPVDAIISDLRMPVMDGPGLYAALKQSAPQYLNKIIYVTGDTLSPHVNAFLSETPVPVIEKPYRLADVQRALSKMLKDNESHSNMTSADS